MAGAPPGRRILVLAPHMDDEVLGCGGTLRKHALAGASITVAYLTDGRRGDPTLNEARLPAAEKRAREDRLVARRKEEARRAAAILGIRDLVFLDRPDGALTTNEELRGSIRELLRSGGPDLVYLPFLTDRHRDHWEANRALMEAARGGAGRAPEFRCCGYEIWSPLVANCLVDISEVVEDKRRAIAQFESQLEHADYLGGILHLNAYRALAHLRGKGHAEAFFLAPFRDYERLYREMIDENPPHP